MSSKKKESNKEQARTTAKVTFTTNGWEDYQHWKSTDAKISQAIDDFVEECTRTPFTGTGKPEVLKGSLSGFWSRRITREHRFVYLHENNQLFVISCRYHYEK
ncbi:Txe/YoeB family addiction module toxin [Pseudomonas aeruginosa]|uniref:Txe/YoeB family addiction module toxin n=1 Tax=Pseudomonas aeruginosa TaxID=287 RepID=UPI0008481EFA|nr:Txe/YoeB family addiction module toxin [Pseudomonas aeruginosa]AON06559.1 toxin YoeB [Pseudomonas aeruginosa]AON12548.1 toxin YoeB [Pseudomonas aeruginosa]AON18535.1 toxin YoeB [Pseudomonas aeruginosa]AON25057.1 toxin YoeB [Pseudomonas aeruginosa]AON30531.1 toxin YoeB [Pseudomonas aeruginosa]